MRLVAAAFVLSLAMAGCAESSSTPSALSSPPKPVPPAPEPTYDEATGSLVVLVTDDEVKPLAGVRIVVLELQREEKTDAAGKATFNNLDPGSYRIVVEALGYESTGRKAEVNPDEVSEVSFVLKAFAVVETYHLIVKRTSQIQLSNSWGSIVTNYSAVCGSCFHTLFFDPVPQQILVENMWTATEVAPVLNARIDIWWRYYDAAGGYHNNLVGYTNRESKFITATEVAELATAKADKLAMAVEGSGTGISVQQRVDTWHIFSYHGDLPEGFTALPPK